MAGDSRPGGPARILKRIVGGGRHPVKDRIGLKTLPCGPGESSWLPSRSADDLPGYGPEIEPPLAREERPAVEGDVGPERRLLERLPHRERHLDRGRPVHDTPDL